MPPIPAKRIVFAAGTIAFARWYWENPSDEEMTITFTSSDFYSWADEFRQRFDPVKHKGIVDRTRHELSGPKSPAPSL